MMISTRGRYALRIMAELALHDPNEYVTLKHIADRQNISEKYLEAIVKGLVSGGLVIGVRGKGGGYKLSRLPKEYTAAEILKAVDESLAPVACLEGDENTCERAAICPTLPMWEKLDKLIKDFFEGITLDSLIK